MSLNPVICFLVDTIFDHLIQLLWRHCKYGGDPEYWIEVREMGEKGQEKETKKQRKEVTEDHWPNIICNDRCSHILTPSSHAIAEISHTAVSLPGRRLTSLDQDTSNEPIAEVDTSKLAAMRERSTASSSAAANATSEATYNLAKKQCCFKHLRSLLFERIL